MKKKIKDIANVRSGVYLKEAPEGKVYYLQVNDFDKSKNEFCPVAPSVDPDGKTVKHILSEGDVLFLAKGTSNFGAVFHAEIGKALASSSFLVIRIIGKKGGDFFTPAEVSSLLAKLTKSKPGARICDPTCGSGSLLIKAGQEVGNDNFSLYGQELNGSTWALAMMNMFLHGFDNATIRLCGYACRNYRE